MRDRFDEQLKNLNNELIAMGAMCEDAISSAVKYLIERDDDMKRNAVETEKNIDRQERNIENLCMKLLTLQQPVAGDLRIISSALKMISDMERIGDQASDIAEIADYATSSEIRGKVHIEDMARATIKMVTESVESFVNNDEILAHEVIALDNDVDEMFGKVRAELVDAIHSSNGDAEALIDLLMIAKYFERIGDHAENIAECVIYSITGKHAGDE